MAKMTQTFQAETKELLNLMIHSLYSHREIFLRELISNASDAIEKLKFESLVQPSLASEAASPEIRLEPDHLKKTLSILDNGIGMSFDEVTENIGTIARSGTKAFLQAKQELKENPELIGQFGVGFYSAFMVANKVVLHTQKAGTTQGVVWESDGAGTYTIEEQERPEGAGTTITLHLKETQAGEEGAKEGDSDQQDFTDPWTLKQIVRKYSDFIAFPIKMKTEQTKSVDGKSETVIEDETLNSQKALWLRSPSEIKPEEYQEFYRHLSHDWSEPLKTVHYKAEGTLEFVSIFYIPSQKPFDYNMREHKTGLSLYVKRVFIKGDCEELLPPYLRFVRGMVDSDDLSLNVSREILQQNHQIARIKKALTSKVLATLKELIEKERSQYEKFWDHFGTTLKEGIALDPTAQGEKLKDLILFRSTHGDGWTSLSEYVSRMKPSQKAIYFITGESLSHIKNSPYLEKLKSKDFEVLLMTDRVDAWVAPNLERYDEKPLQSIMSDHLDISSEEEKKAEEAKLKEAESHLRPLLDVMKGALQGKVKEVKLSDRLTESPACLVSQSSAASAHMERLLESMGQTLPKQERILEINPSHPLYSKMLQLTPDQQGEWAEILYGQALLNEGSMIEDPLQYSQKIAKLMLSIHP